MINIYKPTRYVKNINTKNLLEILNTINNVYRLFIYFRTFDDIWGLGDGSKEVKVRKVKGETW